MSTSVYSWDSNPAVDRRLYPISTRRAEQEVVDGISKFVQLANGRLAIQRLPPEELEDNSSVSESIGIGNLVPFGVVHHRMIAPKPLHYEVPMAGDRTVFARHRRRRILVSSRNLFSRQRCAVAALSPA
jgi:hypothetical protein